MSPEMLMMLRVSLAAGLGAVIGLNRQRRNKPAGLRTHVLVAVGGALATVAGILYTETLPGGDSLVRADLVRVVAAVVTGIGFLGAGAMIRDRRRVWGVTTAAGIWVTAIIGVTAGLGYYLLATGTTFLMLLVIVVGRIVGHRIAGEDDE